MLFKIELPLTDPEKELSGMTMNLKLEFPDTLFPSHF